MISLKGFPCLNIFIFNLILKILCAIFVWLILFAYDLSIYS